MVREVANRVIQAVAWLSPDPMLLIVGVAADLAAGDPVYPWHPVRLIGRTLTWIEGLLRAAGLDGYPAASCCSCCSRPCRSAR